ATSKRSLAANVSPASGPFGAPGMRMLGPSTKGLLTLGPAARYSRGEILEQTAEALEWRPQTERAERRPDAGLVRGDHRFAGAPFQLGDSLDGTPRRARAQQRVRIGPAHARGECHDLFGIAVVDALVTGGGGLGLALDVQHLEARGLEIGAQPLVVPLGI